MKTHIPPSIWQFGSNVFGGYWDRPLALATGLDQLGYPVTYVELMPSIRNLIQAGRTNPLDWLGILSKPKSVGKVRVRATSASIPMKGPTTGLVRRLNICRGRNVIRRLLHEVVQSSPRVFIVHNPIVWPMVGPFVKDADVLCYDWMDNWHALFGKNQARIFQLEEIEKEILACSNLIFAISSVLMEKYCTKAVSKCVLIRNGVDTRRFALQPPFGVSDLEHLKRPLLGYIGSLASWVDTELLESLALHRPDATVVLVGRIETDISRLARLPNVAILGSRKYDDVPTYMHALDVCLNPVRQDDAAAAADPLKIYEYLATGNPIVSIDQPEVRRLGTVVALASGRADFLNLVDTALVGDSPELRLRRKSVANENSWKSRALQVAHAIENYLEHNHGVRA